MRLALRLLALLATVFASRSVVASSSVAADDNPDIVRIVQGDPDMTAAIREARVGLDGFLRLAANPPVGVADFSLKVGLPLNDKDVEFVWVRPFRRDGADFVGRLVNTPRDFPGLSLGQQIAFDRANIIDFAYRDGNQLRGHFTTCVLLKRMPAKQRAAVLAENPIACAG